MRERRDFSGSINLSRPASRTSDSFPLQARYQHRFALSNNFLHFLFSLLDDFNGGLQRLTDSRLSTRVEVVAVHMQGYTPEPPYAVDAEAPEADKVIYKLF